MKTDLYMALSTIDLMARDLKNLLDIRDRREIGAIEIQWFLGFLNQVGNISEQALQYYIRQDRAKAKRKNGTN